jgi:pyruvate formate lyase activating enzyme
MPQPAQQSLSNLHEALLWEPLDGGRVRCNLCAHRCVISDGHVGICRVRCNQGGRLYTMVYELAVSGAVDPIEKKPLFHFLPGTTSFSVATPGCNFSCKFCQNWDISQMPKEFEGRIEGTRLPPKRVVELAVSRGCRSISYTYTEPTIFFEYAYDTAREATAVGLKNVFVTNGFMTPEMLEMMDGYLHAANVDLKSFSDEFYRRVCGGRLQPVLDSIALMHKMGIWVEVTTLVVPGSNDSEEELRSIAEFVAGVSRDIPWHVSRFHPDYKMTDRGATPISVIRRAVEIGREAGLKFVYAGNVPGEESESTFCPKCGTALIRRHGFWILETRYTVSEDGSARCPNCREAIPLVLDHSG